MGDSHAQGILAQLKQAERDLDDEDPDDAELKERITERREEVETELSDTFYGVVRLEGVTEQEARWLLNVMEAVCEDEGSLAVSDIRQPDEWSVGGPYQNQPLIHSRIRRVLHTLDAAGSRPRPRGIADRLGVDWEPDHD